MLEAAAAHMGHKSVQGPGGWGRGMPEGAGLCLETHKSHHALCSPAWALGAPSLLLA